MNKQRVLSCLRLLILVLAASSSRAAGDELRITSLSGTVTVQRAADPTQLWQRATIGLVMLPGDFVRTSADSTALLSAADGTTFRIRPDTLFEVGASSKYSGVPPGPAAREALPPRPPDVAEERWVALSPTVGIVLSPESPGSGSTLEGTLRVRRGNSWIRIRLTAPPVNPYQVVPAR